MVALLDNSNLPSKTALRARGATSTSELRRAIGVKSCNRIELGRFAYGACRRLGLCSNKGNRRGGAGKFLGNLNHYGYADSSPSAALDPSGHWEVIAGPTDYGDPEALDFEIDYAIIVDPANFPNPKPVEAWIKNIVTIYVLDSNCTWKKAVRPQYDFWPLSKNIAGKTEIDPVTGRIALFDTHLNLTGIKNPYCVFLLHTQKLMYFNPVGFVWGNEGRTAVPERLVPPRILQVWNVPGVRGPMGEHNEYYLHFRRKNCSCECMRDVLHLLPENFEGLISWGGSFLETLMYEVGRNLAYRSSTPW